MTRRLAMLAAAAALLLTPLAAHGGGVYGPSGLFLHPTAYLPPDRVPTFGATYYTQTHRADTGTHSHDWVPVFYDQRLSERFQGGLVYLHLSNHDPSYGASARYQLSAEGARRPALVVAADYLTGDLRTASAYLVASRQFRAGRHPIRTHLGYVVTRRSDTVHGTDHAPFAGVELFLTPDLRLFGEFEEKMEFYPRAPVAVGLMWNPSSTVGLGIGWVNTGRSADSRFFIGVGYKIRGVR